MRRFQVSGPELGTLAHMLRKVDFFAPLTVGQMEEVLPHVLMEQFQPGETVFKQGEAGDFFGEMALISNEERGATVKCAEPARRKFSSAHLPKE